MKAARFFSICEIVCFVGLALSYAGEFLCAFVAQGTDKDIFQMGLFLFWLLIGPLAICNLICAAVMYRRLSDPAVRRTLWRCIIAMKCIAIPMFLLNFFVPDYDLYMRDRGLNVDLRQEMPAATFTDADALADSLRAAAYDYDALYAFQSKYVENTKNNNAAILANFVLTLLQKKDSDS